MATKKKKSVKQKPNGRVRHPMIVESRTRIYSKASRKLLTNQPRVLMAEINEAGKVVDSCYLDLDEFAVIMKSAVANHKKTKRNTHGKKRKKVKAKEKPKKRKPSKKHR